VLLRRRPAPLHVDRGRELVSLLGHERYAQQVAAELSGGPRQRLAVAWAALLSPAVAGWVVAGALIGHPVARLYADVTAESSGLAGHRAHLAGALHRPARPVPGTPARLPGPAVPRLRPQRDHPVRAPLPTPAHLAVARGWPTNPLGAVHEPRGAAATDAVAGQMLDFQPDQRAADQVEFVAVAEPGAAGLQAGCIRLPGLRLGGVRRT
jgi:hypothetical protein